MSGKLLLLPNVLDETLAHAPFLPASLPETISHLNGLIAESEKAARKYLRRFISRVQLDAVPIRLLNEHTTPAELDALLRPIESGEIWGLISDAGLPCIADPGAHLVQKARQARVYIEAIPGPSSIILALQLSGFSGQCFAFHGYLPREEHLLKTKLLQLEEQAQGMTQIWIEAPYRNQKMLDTLKNTLKTTTLLCVATNLTSPTQEISSYSIMQWKTISLYIDKNPSIFLIYRKT